ncbi:HNH endonuclease [Armatimonas sp.]|uniref:HNH endonuclease n=1 Tax=Armatimonas sp. TaxID=1872638 RepID=UPI003750A13D
MEEPITPQQKGALAKARKIREAYCASPNCCRQCGEAILPKLTERLQEVRRRLFCSRSCANGFQNALSPKRSRKDRICKHCGKVSKEGTEDRQLCEECWQAFRVRTEARCKGNVSRRTIYVHAASVIKQRAKYCQRCGYALFVDTCHLRAIKDFPETALLSEINAPENLLYLCPNCHHELDAGLLVWNESSGIRT